jgi:hypothetical protein
MEMMNKMIMKHMFTRAKDCEIDYELDFAKKTLELRSDFISPALLVSFLSGMHRRDDRLIEIGVEGAIEITSRLATTLCVDGVKYRLRAYEASAVINKPTIEIELFPIKERK